MRHIAGVILEDEFGRILLQLRDDKPTIASPNMWGLFGGSVEQGEKPFDAAIREIEEELCILLSPDQLMPVLIYQELPMKWFHAFHHPIIQETINTIVLVEGQRFGLWSKLEIQSGLLDGHVVAPHALDILNAYFDKRQ